MLLLPRSKSSRNDISLAETVEELQRCLLVFYLIVAYCHFSRSDVTTDMAVCVIEFRSDLAHTPTYLQIDMENIQCNTALCDVEKIKSGTAPEVPNINVDKMQCDTAPELPTIDVKKTQCDTVPEIPTFDVEKSQCDTPSKVLTFDLEKRQCDTAHQCGVETTVCNITIVNPVRDVEKHGSTSLEEPTINVEKPGCSTTPGEIHFDSVDELSNYDSNNDPLYNNVEYSFAKKKKHFEEEVSSCEYQRKQKTKRVIENKPEEKNDADIKLSKSVVICLMRLEKEIYQLANVSQYITHLIQKTIQWKERKKKMKKTKTLCFNLQKDAKKKRSLGLEYVRPNTQQIIGKKLLGGRCNSEMCTKLFNRQCSSTDEEARQKIFTDIYSLGNLQLQREFFVRHVDVDKTNIKTTKKDVSLRKNTFHYFFTVEGLTETGTIETEKRGGRQSNTVIQKDKRIKELIEHHFDRFPKVESHYCRTIIPKFFFGEEGLPYIVHPLQYSDFYDFKEKYEDLVSLCSGDTPLVRLGEHKQFYVSLTHQ
ncbi:hypothetical protein PR048_004821 [Dryococelus australis]|uniref:Uncharacterized protein n=1 Tax=Dryococelus australis TaxID=614101 RepID=A0ABQ9I6I3_9NEOP|nr:hypothetical protein PR048_004821 [Dryococelus australis]